MYFFTEMSLFLFQQFLSAEGKYVPAVPIKGSICINIGNMMQKLTSDRLIAGVMVLCSFFQHFLLNCTVTQK